MSQVGLESKLEAFQNLSKTSETLQEECLPSTLSIRDLHGFGRCHCDMHICSRCVNLIHTDTTIVVGGTNCNCGVLGAVWASNWPIHILWLHAKLKSSRSLFWPTNLPTLCRIIESHISKSRPKLGFQGGLPRWAKMSWHPRFGRFTWSGDYVLLHISDKETIVMHHMKENSNTWEMHLIRVLLYLSSPIILADAFVC